MKVSFLLTDCLVSPATVKFAHSCKKDLVRRIYKKKNPSRFPIYPVWNTTLATISPTGRLSSKLKFNGEKY